MKIAVIGAMEEEVTILRSKLEQTNREVIANCEFTSGFYEGKEVVLLKSGIGKVNAAMSTTILLDRFKPDVVINTGSAGGFHHSLNVGDIVISTEVRHHDVDVTAFDYEYGQVPNLPAAYKADSALIQAAEDEASELGHIQVVKGTIATGDSFMSDPDRVAFIRGKFEDLYAVEMEARLSRRFLINLIRRLLSSGRSQTSPEKNLKFHLTNFWNRLPSIRQILCFA